MNKTPPSSNAEGIEVLPPNQRRTRAGKARPRLKSLTTTVNEDMGRVARVARESTGEALVQMLRERGTMEMAVDALVRNLNAKKSFLDEESGKLTTWEDGATQVKAAQLLIANEVGDPIKRQQILTGQIDNTEEWVEKLSKSPSGILALEKMIADAKSKMQALGLV